MTISHDIDLNPAATSGRAGVGTHRAAVVLTATAGALLIWAIADPLAGVDLTVSGGTHVGPGAVTAVSLLVGLAAVGLAVLLTRVTSRARRIWHVVAWSALVVSLGGPLGAASPAAGLTLTAMHLVVGGTLIFGVGRTIEPRHT